MYEIFGFSITSIGEQSLTLFIPNNGVDAAQYARRGRCGIAGCPHRWGFQTALTRVPEIGMLRQASSIGGQLAGGSY